MRFLLYQIISAYNLPKAENPEFAFVVTSGYTVLTEFSLTATASLFLIKHAKWMLCQMLTWQIYMKILKKNQNLYAYKMSVSALLVLRWVSQVVRTRGKLKSKKELVVIVKNLLTGDPGKYCYLLLDLETAFMFCTSYVGKNGSACIYQTILMVYVSSIAVVSINF